MRLLTTRKEDTLQQILGVANYISLISDRYVVAGATTSSLTPISKHTTEDIWWINYDEMFPHLGTVGQAIATLLVGTTDNGEPNMNPDVFTMVEVEDLIAEGYLPPEENQ